MYILNQVNLIKAPFTIYQALSVLSQITPDTGRKNQFQQYLFKKAPTNYFLQQNKENKSVYCVDLWMTEMMGEWGLKPSTEKEVTDKPGKKFSWYYALQQEVL